MNATKIRCLGMFVHAEEPAGCSSCKEDFNAFYNCSFEIGQVRFTVPFCKKCYVKIRKVLK